MNKQLFDISFTGDNNSINKRLLHPARRNPEYCTKHQYCSDSKELYTLLVYNKNRGGYINQWIVNIPGKEIDKGKIIFALEKIPISSNDKFNVDIYKQPRGEIKLDIIFTDDKRSSFPIDIFIKTINGELVSRQEIHSNHLEMMTIYLSH